MDKLFRILRNNLYALVGKDIVRIDQDKGSYRKVYKIINNIEDTTSYKNCVLKYAKNEQGKIENKREFETWQAVKGTEVEKYFCPIKNTIPQNNFIIMESAKVRNYDSSDALSLKKEMKRDVNLDNIDRDNGSDIHYQNIGYYPPRDRLVLIDYSWGADFDMLKSNN
jgi:hypothetical protein